MSVFGGSFSNSFSSINPKGNYHAAPGKVLLKKLLLKPDHEIAKFACRKLLSEGICSGLER
jgi:hypothetical protein